MVARTSRSRWWPRRATLMTRSWLPTSFGAVADAAPMGPIGPTGPIDPRAPVEPVAPGGPGGAGGAGGAGRPGRARATGRTLRAPRALVVRRADGHVVDEEPTCLRRD